MQILSSFLVGVLFAVGLGISGMMSPAKVQGFLDITGRWDPSLMLVMGGGLMVTLIAYPLIFKRRHPILEEAFNLPTNTKIDKNIILGGAIFGVGWGIGGVCPGPGLANLATLTLPSLVFVLAMVAGWLIHQQVSVWGKKTSSKPTEQVHKSGLTA